MDSQIHGVEKETMKVIIHSSSATSLRIYAAIIASFHCRICFTIYKIYTNALSLVYEPRHRETSSLSLNTTYNGGLIMFKAVYFSEWELCQTGRVHVVPSTDSWASVVPICHLHNCRKSSFPRKFPETMCCGPCSGMFP